MKIATIRPGRIPDGLMKSPVGPIIPPQIKVDLSQVKERLSIVGIRISFSLCTYRFLEIGQGLFKLSFFEIIKTQSIVTAVILRIASL